MKEYLLEQARFNWDVFTPKSKEEFIEYINKSQSNKMETILKILETNKTV